MPLLLLLLLVTTVSYCRACSCIGPPNLCDDHVDFIAAIKVENDGDVDEEEFIRTYAIKLIKFYAADENYAYRDIEDNRLYTASDGGLCGVNLQKDSYYIITGRLNTPEGESTHNMWTGLCFLRRKFQSKYELCDVSVTSCDSDI